MADCLSFQAMVLDLRKEIAECRAFDQAVTQRLLENRVAFLSKEGSADSEAEEKAVSSVSTSIFEMRWKNGRRS